MGTALCAHVVRVVHCIHAVCQQLPWYAPKALVCVSKGNRVLCAVLSHIKETRVALPTLHTFPSGPWVDALDSTEGDGNMRHIQQDHAEQKAHYAPIGILERMDLKKVVKKRNGC